jgi:hypothetical protein
MAATGLRDQRSEIEEVWLGSAFDAMVELRFLIILQRNLSPAEAGFLGERRNPGLKAWAIFNPPLRGRNHSLTVTTASKP